MDKARYIHHDTFSFMVSLPAMSFEDRFCVSRNVDKQLPAENLDYYKYISGWVWFECRGWLHGHLCEVWVLKTRG